MKRIIVAVLAALMLTGCSGGGENTDKTKGPGTLVTDETTAAQSTEDSGERVLAMMGLPDEDGYYTIDFPRSAQDLMPLEQINSRLYPISVAMVQTDTKSFDSINDELLWYAVRLDIAFNHGSSAPFTERDDGNSTQVSLNNLNSFIKDSFKTDLELTADSLPKEAALAGELVTLPYPEPESKGVGFVISEYKPEGNLWYVKGEIISEDTAVFARGEFVLEENGGNASVSHKILSFNLEN